MNWFAMLLAHVLMFYLITWVPLSFLRVHFQVMAPRTRSHLQLYLQMMLNNWLTLVPFFIICPGLGWSPQTLGLQLPTNVFLAVLFLALSLIVSSALVVLGHVLARYSPEVRAYLREPAPAHFPETTTERILFVPFSLTHAFVEELLFRGFMLTYLTRLFLGMPVVPAILLAAFFFGIGHLNQRWVGVLGNGAIGLVLGVLYSATGSLIPGMLVHALFNLRLLLLPRHSSALPGDKGSMERKEAHQVS